MPSKLLRPMTARDNTEAHRASTPFELFFDLTFVVAVSLAAVELAHEVEGGHAWRGLGLFAMVFFAVWWGWLNFSWFASAYDTDDWLYRVVTLVQMGGALTVAAGVPKAFQHEDFTVMTVGYAIMRVAMVFQWLRAARNDPPRRRTALRYAGGIAVVQVLWIARLALPDDLGVVAFAVLVVAELSVPALAERRVMTQYHPRHIAERYGLFTIIVLGEGVLAAGNSVIEALQDGEHLARLITVAVGGLVLLAGMWWVYFTVEVADTLTTMRSTFAWGYGHYLLFAAAAAVSSGLETQISVIAGGEEHASHLAVRLSIGVPVAVYVAVTAALILRPRLDVAGRGVSIVAVVLLGGAGFVPLPPAGTTVVAAVLLVLYVGYLVAARVGEDDADTDTDADTDAADERNSEPAAGVVTS